MTKRNKMQLQQKKNKRKVKEKRKEKQKYLKNNSDSLTLYKNKGLQNMKKYSSI